MSRKSNLDKFQEVMFADKVDISHLSPVEQMQVVRYRFAFTQCLESPSIPDTELRDQLMNEFGISQSQAYRDIASIKIILPNIKAAGKEWIRYMVTEELKLAIKECKDGGADLMKERIMAIDKLAKYNKLDQDDGEQIPWDDIVPIPVEATNDISVMGVKPMENPEEEIRLLYEKYKGDIEIEDIDYQDITDVNNDGDEENIL
jgi:DNA-directed RNA polymerase subunit F